MESEWLELAYINFNKVVMHGRVTAGRDEHGCITEREIEQALTSEQKAAVEDLNLRHSIEMRELLRGFIDAGGRDDVLE